MGIDLRPTMIALSLLMAGGLLVSCTPAVPPQPAASSPATVPTMGDDTAVNAVRPDGPTGYGGAQAAWEDTIEAWPLPVPESFPFPASIPLGVMNDSDYYEATVAAERANLWWECAVTTTIVAASAEDDTETVDYWRAALELWSNSDTRSITYGDAGSADDERTVAMAESCADAAWFTQ